MIGFKVTTPDNLEIRFQYYSEEAPVTSRAFQSILPFSRTFFHARISGQEIWIDDVPGLDIIQENASIFTKPGEVVIGPSKPARVKTSTCFGIYYGEGKGLDACNIFAIVLESDRQKLIELGNRIWKYGALELKVSSL
ncbi:MAG: DUF3830 family protein [Cyclobacteriaceae bacterium]|jgi:hypothetical protein|nr:DUF3830 family protein [Flammeovirgaceae bacterium]MCZ8022093.1 DUF3830 family protein [Cytophagales bacterium]MCZ8328751.1 DUF3830 family protein [Cyclobacteriaceae bacterium]